MVQYGGRFVLDVMPRSVERAFPTFSETNDPADLHTDGTYLEAPPWYFLLYCVRQSEEGGISLLSDSREVVDRLQAMTGGAEALVALQQNFPIRIPDAYALDNSAATYLGAPLLSLDPFSLRWREDTIRDGLTLPPITEAQRRAFELFRSALDAMPQTTLSLHPGDLLALNNQFWRHGRTGFAGDRLVKRVWIR
jgi:alpha-ketoglutarate-dependent taurine dioxygenase